MRKPIWHWTVTAVMLAVLAAGCSSDSKKKSTGPPLTPEDQAELFREFVGPIDSLGGTVAPLVAFGAGAGSWDGFSCDEQGLPIPPLGKVAIGGPVNLALSHLGKSGALGVDSRALRSTIESLVMYAASRAGSTCEYNEQKGAWIVGVDTTEDLSEMVGGHFEVILKMHDTVHFASAGDRQEQPDSSTDEFGRGTHIGATINIKDVVIETDSGSVALDMNFTLTLKSSTAVSGLNAPTVTMNSDFDLTAGGSLAAAVTDTVADETTNIGLDGTMTFAAHVVDVHFPNPAGSGEICPTEGAMSASLGIDFSGEEFSAKGTWSFDIGFTGDGMADVMVESGDYTNEATTEVCSSGL